jgi:tRNA (guanine-N7-)-methyltransferase
MRRRDNTEERLGRCGGFFIPEKCDSPDTRIDVQKKSYLDLNGIFGRSAPLVVEIGCGSGRFACDFALKYPDFDVLAVERMSTVILSGAERAAKENIGNVRFLGTKAELLPKYLPPRSVKSIYLNFSTPLPKSGSEKQRLTSPRFLAVYDGLLAENGKIQQKTDNKDFFDYSINEFSDCGFEIEFSTEDLQNSGIENVMTEYEEKFVSRGMPIYALTAKRR